MTKQREIIAKMTVEEKLLAANQLFHSARALKKAALQSFHPELSEIEINCRVKEAFLYART
jgi:ABC-type branched-subunit amino acid transport system ATPase component